MITSVWTRPGESNPQAADVRKAVFQEEMGWSNEQDRDFMDAYSYQLALLLNDIPVASGRLAYGGPGKAKLDRICVLKKYRRQGIGDGLVKVLDYKAACIGMERSMVEAPAELRRFFERIGFRVTGEAADGNEVAVISMEKETNDGTVKNCSHQCACP